MKLEHLKIKYAFIEGKNPNRIIELTFETLLEEFRDWKKDVKKHNINAAIEEFITKKMEKSLKDESDATKELLLFPDVRIQLREYLKEIME